MPLSSLAEAAPPEVHDVTDPETLIDEPFLLTTLVREQPSSAHWIEHSHAVAELIWVASGVVNVSAAGAIYVLRAGQGLVVPPHMTHGSQVMRSARIGATYLRTVPGALPQDQPVSVSMSRALMEMLQHLNETAMPQDERLRAQQVCLDMIGASRALGPGIPVPDDARIRRITRAILADPADDRSLEQWSVITGTSVSTIARTFTETADMSFVRWRRQVRVKAAMSLLAEGLPVTAVGRRVGYSSPSAFVTAFRQEVGQTPGAYLRGPTAEAHENAAACADSGTLCPMRDIESS
ncbi:helix-turn-helix transcriptional regulator [Leucobacter sp. UCMA 4100]|uniref:helix-turn-helix domain-containing protein n=1 Tax=Leucobacter sp. UCMA 4100 TaxID=2810534 RepID=UPI0022EA4B33|nr:AraC family transcriptional regulator [Leucobacter sp. UCMA 4100]MDA3146889.1 helix-turn-helix transcriptional regulator [Leucobacter sp. UCMA 4100]